MASYIHKQSQLSGEPGLTNRTQIDQSALSCWSLSTRITSNPLKPVEEADLIVSGIRVLLLYRKWRSCCVVCREDRFHHDIEPLGPLQSTQIKSSDQVIDILESGFYEPSAASLISIRGQRCELHHSTSDDIVPIPPSAATASAAMPSSAPELHSYRVLEVSLVS